MLVEQTTLVCLLMVRLTRGCFDKNLRTSHQIEMISLQISHVIRELQFKILIRAALKLNSSICHLSAGV